MNEVNKYFQFSKVDEKNRIVEGYASTEKVDSDGEVVEKGAMQEAMPEFMSLPGGGNLRAMHQPIAAGKVLTDTHDNQGTFISAKVVDDNEWKKVLEKVYTGFSIAGRVVTKVKNRITKLKLSEISLVDRPANPNATFSLIKFDKNNALYEGLKNMKFENPTEEKIRKEVITKMAEKELKEEKVEEKTEKKAKKEVKVEEPKVVRDEVAQKVDGLEDKVDSLVKLLTPEVKVEKATDGFSKLEKVITDKLDGFSKRLDEIEATAKPIPVKTHGVSKSGEEEDKAGSLAKVQSELDRLNEIASDNPQGFDTGIDKATGRPFRKYAAQLLNTKKTLLEKE